MEEDKEQETLSEEVMEQVPAHLQILQEEGETQAGGCRLRDSWPPVCVGKFWVLFPKHRWWPLCTLSFNQMRLKFLKIQEDDGLYMKSYLSLNSF